MEAIFEILFQIIFELLLQILSEILFELGFSALVEPLKNRVERNPVLAAVGYVLFGLIFGGLSLLLFPDPIIKSKIIKLLNFIISPVLIGLSLCLSSWILKRQTISEKLFKMEKFVFGALFALSYSLIRYVFTNL